jgi:RNA-dependent RNA polymerase
MNVHISGIPFTATEEDVSVTLSKKLHSNLFKSISQADHGLVLPFNFSVTFFGRKRNRGQVQPKARTAFLTLPSIDIAEEFLKHFTTSSGIRSIEVHGSRLQFGGIECERPQYRYVDNLRRRPFIAPAHARAKEEKENQLKESISAKYLSFGWRCRNGAYSSEWTCKRPDISFQDEERELHISLSLSSRGEVRCAVLQYHNILSMEITSFGAHPSILITLEKAPAFREEWNSREREIEHYMRVVRGEPRVSWADDCYDPIPRDSIMREMVRRGLRTALLNFNRQLGSNYDEEEDDTPIQCDERLRTTDLRNLEGHAMIAQFTSTSLLVTFESEQDRHTFERLCAVANLRKRRQRMILTVSRQLFSVPNLQRIQSWLAKLNWTIAFQCLSLLHRSLLNPVELFQISAHIHWLLSNGDVFWAEEVMITFGDNLSTLRKDSRAAVFPKTVMDCLLAAVRCITPAYMSAKSLSSANMLKCRHVTFTPTNMLLDGPYLEAVSVQTTRLSAAD